MSKNFPTNAAFNCDKDLWTAFCTINRALHTTNREVLTKFVEDYVRDNYSLAIAQSKREFSNINLKMPK